MDSGCRCSAMIPDGDYDRITREFSGRRINLARPEHSLLFQKATGGVPHTGGELFEADSAHAKTLLRWLESLAPKDPKDVAVPQRLELYPESVVLRGPGAHQRLTAIAHYSDGTRRDVTSLAVLESSNGNSATVTEDFRVESNKRGEAFITARFATHTVGSHVVVVPDQSAPAWPDTIKAQNYIDDLVHAKLRKLDMLPSDLADEQTFLRRVYIDIAGVLPTLEDVDQFVSDQAPDKRLKTIDNLLQRKDFVDLWVMKWAELLQIRSGNDYISYKSTLLYHNWLKEKIASGQPMDQVVRELLTVQGGTFAQPQSNYFEIEKDPLKTAENVAQVFMGVRMQCAQCHNHPFDRWTMDDYYSFAAFFARIARKNGADPRERIVFDKYDGETKHPVTNQKMPPRFPGEAPAEVKQGNQRRQVFAHWLTAPENPYFARNLANIIWAHMMGQGIVEPVDDVRVSNPPSNPELLDALAARLVDYGYDFRKLIRDIASSRTYQLTTRPNESNGMDTRNFTRAKVRRIRAEVLLDCMSQITETQDKFKGLAKGARAVEISDGNTSTYFLDTFGRTKRESVCSCEVVTEPNLSQALHLLNGDTLNKKISQGKVVKAMVDQGLSNDEVLQRLYLRCLSRPPTEEEAVQLAATINPEDPTRSLNEVFWALMNSKEFIFNH